MGGGGQSTLLIESLPATPIWRDEGGGKVGTARVNNGIRWSSCPLLYAIGIDIDNRKSSRRNINMLRRINRNESKTPGMPAWRPSRLLKPLYFV
jgi:hypothetical protein